MVRGSWGARGDIRSRDLGHERQGRHGLFVCGHRLGAGGFDPLGRAGRAPRAIRCSRHLTSFHVQTATKGKATGGKEPSPSVRAETVPGLRFGHVSFACGPRVQRRGSIPPLHIRANPRPPTASHHAHPRRPPSPAGVDGGRGARCSSARESAPRAASTIRLRGRWRTWTLRRRSSAPHWSGVPS